MKIAAGISVADFGDRAVILDVRADRYRMVGARQAVALAALGTGISSQDDAAVRSLIDNRIIDPAGLPDRADRPTIPVIASALEMSRVSAVRLSSWAATIGLAQAIIRIRLTRFSSVLDWAHRLKACHPAVTKVDVERAVGLAQAFQQARMRIPVDRICLRDSLALFSILLQNEVRCDLVFGVGLDPFRAHCWVQADATILSDTLDSARLMTPILTI